MQISMKKNKVNIKVFLLCIFFSFTSYANSEVLILSGCKDLRDSFIKNEYIVDLGKSLMTRNYIYDDKTFKKYRITDLSIKKENFIERFIYEDEDLILTDKIGYPQFYTQLIFKKNNPIINIKTVINSEVGISKLSTCSGVEFFKDES